ncbi:hypothetical protein CVS30_06295 [Arthrobacter psychrolactophilus]|uniref:Uncharacterized protein n=1 Tax=Arthrobacter psychrolactophilus TaxID=92442 RepID=A0A2V5IXB0_9MICC|nr:hypothetical protein [Arthrobacter psychrolactophilus]PYI38923.1 hypothetical protein CVS30_06295 [Arthrobacter psychrolactophilus]
MFWNITADNWAILWGAIIAGGSAALVAMIVLWRTNAHQAKLSRRQLDEQRNQGQLARRIEALSEVSAVLTSMVMQRDADFHQLAALGTEGNAAVMRWRLNNGDAGIAVSLGRLVGDVSVASMYYSGHATPGGKLPGALLNVGVTIHDLNKLVVTLATEQEPTETVADGLKELSADFREELRKHGVAGRADESLQ